ncbi:DUF4781 domain-containing protein (plasmid) [Bosea vestrisii]|uniref:DUF4781 domain-containing protein n=1 Tax=Bosea vestrisii TaxID=151416 RepID=UPI0024DFE826|nr:DUF4781 domain-containing protein [Bosea vestrisii]WID99718.1 DUF4781 domain-containing protein [Bosea vestrisii]
MTASAVAAADTERARPAGGGAAASDDTAAHGTAAFERAVNEAALAPNAAPARQVEPAPEQPDTAEAPQAGPDETRRREIDSWVDNDSDHSGGFLGIGGTDSNDKVVEALRGGSRLGGLDRPEQAYLVDRMLDRWAAGRGDGPGGAHRLATNLGDTPELRDVVAERFAVRAGEMNRALANRPTDESWRERAQASAIADSAVTALSGPAYDEPEDLRPLRDMVSGLPPQAAGDFARALATAPNAPAIGGSPMLSRTLQALNHGPPSEATSAFVQNAFAGASLTDYGQMSGDLPQQLGRALSREWHPDDAALQNTDANRLTGILNTSQGRQLFAASESVPLAARVNALARIRMDPGITAETLEATDDPWTNPAIVRPEAQDIARQYLTVRGDAPRQLAGSDLDNTVGFAMGLPPAVPDGTSPANAEAGAARGQFSYYGSGDQAAAIRAVTDQIRAVAGSDAPNVTVLPVSYSSGETGPVQLPLFRVTDASGAERFVDNTGRRYENFDDWRENNKLPPGHMTYPEGGHLSADENGAVRLGEGNTPETVDSFGEHLSSALDTAALVGGVIAGGVLIVGSGGLATPVVVGAGAVAVGAGAWGAYRSGSELVDRSQHGQSINPLEDAQARNLWLNLGASALSVGAFGSAARLAQLGRAGRTIAPLEASAHGYLQASAAIVDTAAIANQGVDLARNWNEMSGGERATALLSMGFWATATVAGARATGSRPGDMFNPVTIRDNVLRWLPPGVTPDPALPGNEVRIDYDPTTGVVQGIRHGPQASQADIDLHVATAQNIQRSLTLEGQLGAIFADHGEPPPGTLGWAAQIDIGKVLQRMSQRATELDEPNLSPARRAELSQANDVDRQHLDELAADVESMVRDPAHANIAARNTNFSERDTAAERQQLPVGATTRTIGDAPATQNEVTWTVNANHETVRAEATIRHIPPKKERPDEENELTANVGHEGGRTGEFPANDNGGHIVGYQFLHDQGLVNMFPQNSQFNQQVYTQFETEMRQWVEAGGEVRVKVEVGARGANDELQWGGARPDNVEVTYEVINPETGEMVYRNFARFKNEQDQSFDGFEEAVGTNPNVARTRRGKVDVPAEMRRLLEQ